MPTRRRFLGRTAAGLAAAALAPVASAFPFSANAPAPPGPPTVISTWDAGRTANPAAWAVLAAQGTALDAVEAGVRVTESENTCCVGLNGYPDRDGIVTLDACIMDHAFNCGGVAALERIQHPISVARRVMEATPHVLLVGEGAQQFALAQGFALQPQKLSAAAAVAYKEWLKTSNYAPVLNGESRRLHPTGPVGDQHSHDTVAMLALDAHGHLAGSCTTSGMRFKMHGRVGDSPLIGSGLYVDNAVGAAAATGQGEDVIRIAGAALIVELMRQGQTPQAACEAAVRRIAAIKGPKAKDIQVAFIALDRRGRTGAFALQTGFDSVLSTTATPRLSASKFLL